MVTTTRTLELILAYSGVAYQGWQVQPRVPTVQGVLQRALREVLQHAVKTTGASRTDTGVHAHDQHVTLTTDNPIPLNALQLALNHRLPDDIRVLVAQECEPDFCARYRARAKHYAYFIHNTSQPLSPFATPYCWNWRSVLNIEAMQAAAECLVGHRSFPALKPVRDHRVSDKTSIQAVRVSRVQSLVVIDVLGSHFFYHMVRIMAGSLLKVGRGDWSPRELSERLALGQRSRLWATMPGQGLHLFKVFYTPAPHEFSPQSHRFASTMCLL